MFGAPTATGAATFGAPAGFGALGTGAVGGSAPLLAGGAGAAGGGNIFSSILGGASGGGGMPTFDQILGAGQIGLDVFSGIQQGNMQQDALRALQRSGQLPNFAVAGPGGVGGAVGPGGGTFGLGELDPIRQALVGSATGMAGNIPTGVPGQVSDAFANFQNALGAVPGGNIAGLTRNIGLAQGAATGAFGDIQSQRANPFASALMGTALGGAQQQAAAAGRGFADVQAETLANLRALAAPEEQRQMNALGEALFGTGRTGTTGGALQTEAFARGLGQADLSRQLAATQEARAVQQQALGQATGLSNIGTGVRGLQEDLLSSAFGRFGDTLGLASDLEGTRFGRQLDLSNLGVNRAGLGVTSAIQQAGILPQLQGQFLAPLGTALTQQAGLQTQALQPFQQALSGAGAQGNLAIGAASPALNAITSPTFQASPTAGTLSDIFGTILNR